MLRKYERREEKHGNFRFVKDEEERKRDDRLDLQSTDVLKQFFSFIERNLDFRKKEIQRGKDLLA